MTNISSGNIKRFLSATALALAIPLTAAANPGNPRAGEGGSDCGAMTGHRIQGGGMGHHAMGGLMSPRHLHALNLSEAQHDKVFEIRHGQAPGMREKGKALHKAEAELRQLTSTPDYSEGKAKALADQIGKLTFEMTLARSKSDHQIYEILTPEQRTQLAEMKPAHNARHHHGAGPRGKAGEGQAPAR